MSMKRDSRQVKQVKLQVTVLELESALLSEKADRRIYVAEMDCKEE